MKSYLHPLFLAVVFITSCNNRNEPDAGNTESQLFELLPAEHTGISFENNLTEGLNTNILMYEYFYNGAGIATGDFNGDGLDDLYFTSNMGENKFYLNKGDFKFEDITLQSLAGGRPGPWKSGVNAVDINGDGRLDIYLCYSGAMPAEKERTSYLLIPEILLPEFQFLKSKPKLTALRIQDSATSLIFWIMTGMATLICC